MEGFGIKYSPKEWAKITKNVIKKNYVMNVFVMILMMKRMRILLLIQILFMMRMEKSYIT